MSVAVAVAVTVIALALFTGFCAAVVTFHVRVGSAAYRTASRVIVASMGAGLVSTVVIFGAFAWSAWAAVAA